MFLGQYGNVWLNTSKATILHEYGHLVQNSAFGSFGTPLVEPEDDYCAAVADNAGFDACRCDQVVVDGQHSDLCGDEFWDRLHCLNSREFISAAFSEGWGHYRAALVLNNTTENGAIFPYYKDMLSSTLTQLESPVAHQVQPTSATRWMETKCTDNMINRSTELDWLSFFYHVGSQTTFKYPLGDMLTVVRGACGGAKCNPSTNAVTWSNLVSSVTNQGWTADKKNHFMVSGSTYGVDH